jgi:hypothetical protein
MTRSFLTPSLGRGKACAQGVSSSRLRFTETVFGRIITDGKNHAYAKSKMQRSSSVKLENVCDSGTEDVGLTFARHGIFSSKKR